MVSFGKIFGANIVATGWQRGSIYLN